MVRLPTAEISSSSDRLCTERAIDSQSPQSAQPDPIANSNRTYFSKDVRSPFSPSYNKISRCAVKSQHGASPVLGHGERPTHTRSYACSGPLAFQFLAVLSEMWILAFGVVSRSGSTAFTSTTTISSPSSSTKASYHRPTKLASRYSPDAAARYQPLLSSPCLTIQNGWSLCRLRLPLQAFADR